MLWISLIVLFLLFFAGLIFFLWYVLKRNYSKATECLQSLSKDVVAKEEEANRILQNAQRESKKIIAQETQAAQEVKEQIVKEAQGQKDHILLEANNSASEIAEKAQRNADFIQKEFDRKIDERAKEMVSALISRAVPKDFLKGVHQKLVEDSEKGALDLKHLKLPEKVKDAKIVTAFPLTEKQQGDLKKKLKAKVGTDVALKVSEDPLLIAGLAITIGSIVVDASLKYRIQKAMQE